MQPCRNISYRQPGIKRWKHYLDEIGSGISLPPPAINHLAKAFSCKRKVEYTRKSGNDSEQHSGGRTAICERIDYIRHNLWPLLR